MALLCVVGCANKLREESPALAADRSADYPVRVVVAAVPVAADVGSTAAGREPVPGGQVPVMVETPTAGRADGALQFAERGALECGLRSLGAGPYFPFVFLPCAVLTVPTMAAVGAWLASPKADVDAIRQSSDEHLQTPAPAVLAEKARAYLERVAGRPISLTQGLQPSAAAAPGVRPDYPPQAGASGTLFELGLREIRLAGSGKRDQPLCLYMEARGRKIDTASGRPIDERQIARTVECRPASVWLSTDGALFAQTLDAGQQMLAEQLADQLYLVHRPQTDLPTSAEDTRTVPAYVLAPLSPPPPESYLDLRSLTGKARHVQGWGGMHFVDVDNLLPAFRWEAFPRPFDLPDGAYSDVSYTLRIYSGEVRQLRVAEPATLLHEVTDLNEPAFSLSTPLQPCRHHFWTVRAHFTLNGVRRVTEWAGAYFTAGGEVSPSYRYFYPFRTPPADQATCGWLGHAAAAAAGISSR
ncbi:MAG: hypothetical protein KDI82_00165 [Gammaproteobacteria bacterium]|nr:hypothetical protein [Gammaproteobacteria bacterium]